MNLLQTWQFNIVGFLVFIVIFFQFYKLAVKEAKKDGAATIALQLIAGMLALALAPLFPLAYPDSIKPYILLIVASVFYALYDRLQTTTRKHLEVSVFSILNQFVTIFLIIFGISLFQEPVFLEKLFGAVLILLGNAIIFYKKEGLKLNSYALLGLLSTFIFAIAISIDVGISGLFNLPIYIAFTLIVPAIMVWLVEKLSLKEIKAELKPQVLKYYLITGISWTLAIFFSLRAFRFGSFTTIATLQATSVIFNVLVAYVFLGERSDKFKKIAAALLVILGVYLTTIQL